VKGKGVVVRTKSGETMEYDLYMRVVSMTAESASYFMGSFVVPFDLGPAGGNYRRGARVWGFPSRPETAEEKAHRLWTVAGGGTVRL
jgi:hypothetical protein